MTDSPLMKAGLGPAAVRRIGTALQHADAQFSRDAFVKTATRGLDKLELKDRVGHLIEALHRYLPEDFKETASLLVRAKEHWDPGDPDDPLRGFAGWPLIDYIPAYGLDAPTIALPALRELTSLFSAEFAIRPFILQQFVPTVEHLTVWCDDPDPAVRRLVSEGTRPRLPWGQRLPPFVADPSPIFPLLERLKSDSSASVRRSVANNLNDISKDHPERVIEICRAWQAENLPHGDKLIRHALRTLIKAGHPDVFPLLGYTASPEISVKDPAVSPRDIKLGESVTVTATLVSTGRSHQRVVLDYAMHHVKANGRTTAKVFKLKELSLAPGESVTISRKHTFRNITTRAYHPGTHAVELLINGVPQGPIPFELRM